MRPTILLVLAGMLFFFSNCKRGFMDRYGPFYVLNDSTVVMNGDMGSRINIQFNKLLEKYPNIKLIIMEECPGSRDDEKMFEAALTLHERKINTHLNANSIIESGAVDFYLAGDKRSKDAGAKIGVHAWSDGNMAATYLPENDQEHQVYINFYKNIGLTQQEADSLYLFIINAASPENIHWMTETEINQFNITNN
ncbi:MAG: hypothetical protein P8I93_03005 [Crocinitomicaceae bacterium]|nr:hypothetical protein [Crocinitomicaceae bacterium]